MVQENLKWVPFTQLANLTGTPAMSVPTHLTTAGLPLGTQFVAAPGGEGLLLRLAAQIEQAQPWAHRRPMLHVANPSARSRSACMYGAIREHEWLEQLNRKSVV